MTRLAALAAIVVLLLAGPLTGTALADRAVPDAPVPGGLLLDLDELAPRVVTAEGPSVLTVTGTLTNTGDAPVTAIGVRLQRGDPLRTEGDVREALDGGAATDSIAPRFQELPDALGPGEQAPVRLTVPLRGAPETGLALASTGVHELLVNVNGVPGDGDRARLAAVRMLLPVLGLPAGPDGSPAVPDVDGAAVPATLLYPVVDRPRRLVTVPGEPVLLADDTLADAFGEQGRLGGLVAALAAARDTARDAVCTAVDPDLLQTASAMRAGYEVVAADGSRTPGRGADAAGRWLDGLAAAVAGRCVVALPFADADVVALTRGGFAPQVVDAVDAGRDLVGELLGTPALPSTTWPADGLLDAPALDVLGTAGIRSVVLTADGVDLPSGTTGGTTALEGGASAVLADPLLALAAGTAAGPGAAAGGGAAAAARPATGPLATQDALGALAFRALAARASDEDGGGGGPLLLTPPHRWDVDGTSAAALLDGVAQLADLGLLAPRDLAGAPAAGGGAPRAVQYPPDAAGQQVAPDAVASIGTVLADLADLASSAVDDGQGVDPDALFGPLRLVTVRAASAAWRGEPDLAAAAAAGTARRIAEIRASVAVLEPPSPISLGTSDSPLLITVDNRLPVTVRVRVELASTSGLRVAPIPVVEVPPLGRRQVQASVEVLRSGVFTVDAAVLSQDGGRLGPPSRLQVRSTAYGTITLWLTGTAGVLLVVLAGRRVLRRVRAEPGRTARPVPPPTGPLPAMPPTTGRPPTGPTTSAATTDRATTDRATTDPATRSPSPLPGPARPEGRPEDLMTTVPGRTLPASSAPSRPGRPTGPSRPVPSGPASAAGAPPVPPRPAPRRPTDPPRRPETP